MADTHFYNNIRYFCNLKLCISIATAGDSKAEIYRYNNINLAIKVGKCYGTRVMAIKRMYSGSLQDVARSIVRVEGVRR